MGNNYVSASEHYGEESVNPFGEVESSSFLFRKVPIINQVKSYQKSNFRFDVAAGIALAALAIPQSLAYAQTAGMPVVTGLYALLIPIIAYAVFGSSRRLMTGPTATAALLVIPAVLTVTTDPAEFPIVAGLLALIVGVIFVLASVLRLGWIANYFSSAVLLGFLTGLALTLIAGQLAVFTGAEFEGETPLQEYYFFFVDGIGTIDRLTLAVGLACLFALLAGSKFIPKFPTLILVTVVAIAASYYFDFDSLGVILVGEIPAGLPSLSIPALDTGYVFGLIPAAIGIAIVTFADAVLIARAMVDPDDPPVEANQELLALGSINIASAVSGAFPIGASGSRSAVNVRLGGKTQIVGIVTAIGVALVLLYLTAPLAYLPKAALAAIIIYAALGLIEIKEWKLLARVSRREFAIAFVVVIGMLTIGLLPAISLAVVLSIIDTISRNSKPSDAVLGLSASENRFVDIRRKPEAKIIPGIVVYRWDGRLFFANSGYFRDRVLAALIGSPYEVRYVILSAEAITNIDVTGAQILRDLIIELEKRGITFLIARSRSRLTELIDELKLSKFIPPEHRFHSVREAAAWCELPKS
jgi:high affinity sulfate transporter 1